MLVLLNKAEAKTIQVCKSCPVKTIRAGILAASANDVLIISKGIYKEYNLEIKKPVTIVSNENAVIDADFKGNIFQIYSDNVTIQGLKLINVAQSYTKEFAAVLIFKANNFKILNNTLDKVFFGILVEKSKKGIIKGNTIRGEGKDEAGSGNGVHLWSCSDILS